MLSPPTWAVRWDSWNNILCPVVVVEAADAGEGRGRVAAGGSADAEKVILTINTYSEEK